MLRSALKKTLYILTKYKLSRWVLFNIFVLIAKVSKVETIFIERFRVEYYTNHSYQNALRFIWCYIRLGYGGYIPGYSYNLAKQLETKEEVSKTITLLDKFLKDYPSREKSEPVKIQKIRLLSKQDQLKELDRMLGSFFKSIVSKGPTGNVGDLCLGKEALTELKSIFEEFDKRFFLASGTLLGAVRDQGFVNNDYDIDLGVFADEISINEIRNMLDGSNFYLDRDFDCELSYLYKNKVRIDIFLWERTNHYYLTQSFGGAHKYRWTPFELIRYQFLGDDYWIPKDYSLNLKENYGNWDDKVLFFDWAFDVPCREYGDRTEAILYLANRFRDAVNRKDRYIASKAASDLYRYFDIDVKKYFPNTNWKI